MLSTQLTSHYRQPWPCYFPNMIQWTFPPKCPSQPVQISPNQPCPQMLGSTSAEPSAIVIATSFILALPRMNTPETSVFSSLFAHPLISIATKESSPSAWIGLFSSTLTRSRPVDWTNFAMRESLTTAVTSVRVPASRKCRLSCDALLPVL